MQLLRAIALLGECHMRVGFTVKGRPPKKHGEKSMWARNDGVCRRENVSGISLTRKQNRQKGVCKKGEVR